MKKTLLSILTLAILVSTSISGYAMQVKKAPAPIKQAAVLTIPAHSDLIIKFESNDDDQADWCEASCECGDFTYQCDKDFSCDRVCIDDDEAEFETSH